MAYFSLDHSVSIDVAVVVTFEKCIGEVQLRVFDLKFRYFYKYVIFAVQKIKLGKKFRVF